MAVVFGGLLQGLGRARGRGESGAGELNDVSGKSLRGRGLRIVWERSGGQEG